MQVKQIKKKATKVAKSYTKVAKSYTKPVLYILLSLVLLYGAIYLFTRKERMPVVLQVTIDSLTKANVLLIEHQKQVDSTIKIYEAEAKQFNNEIDRIKEKTTIIREYYYEQSQAASSYNPTQVDSFFRNRYDY